MCSGFNWCITLIFVFNQGFYFLLMSLVFFKLWKLKYSNIIKYSNIHHMGHMVSVNILRKYQLVFLHWITPIIIYLVTLSMQWLLETYLSIKYLLVWPSMRFYCSNDCSVIFFIFFHLCEIIIFRKGISHVLIFWYFLDLFDYLFIYFHFNFLFVCLCNYI